MFTSGQPGSVGQPSEQDEISDGHLAAGEERRVLREETDHDQEAADGFNHSCRAVHAHQRLHLSAEQPKHLLQAEQKKRKPNTMRNSAYVVGA